MSEVIRYLASYFPYEGLDLNGQCARHDGEEFVHASDFDRVTAERDAALDTAALKYRDAIEAQTAVTGWARKYDALQQRLTAADERADLLEGRVSMLLRELQELINDDDGILVAAELSTGFVWHALQKHGKAIKAALKSAEGGGDEVGRASLSDKALGLIDEEIRKSGMPS